MHITDIQTTGQPCRTLANFITEVLSSYIFLLQIQPTQSFRKCRERVRITQLFSGSLPVPRPHAAEAQNARDVQSPSCPRSPALVRGHEHVGKP